MRNEEIMKFSIIAKIEWNEPKKKKVTRKV